MRKILTILAVLLAVACGSTAVATVDRINVTEPPYNAIPNDGIDDTAAINLAVAAGTSIYFPPGSYNYNGRLTLPATKSYRVYGDGHGVSTILFSGTNPGIYYSASVSTASLNVEGLTLEAISTTPGTAISATFNPGFASLGSTL